MGFEVRAASTAREADEAVAKGDIRLVLLDLGLPDRNGESWLAGFRAHDRETAVLVISGVIDPARKAALLWRGADDFVSKPFEVQELEARIAVAMRRPTLGKLTVGKAVIDPIKHAVCVDDFCMSLTKREFQTLSYLASHREAPTSSAALANAVLGGIDAATVECARVHICNLREKLRPFADFFEIHTIEGEGYRVDAR
jgi:DNA-binding response OmpR family regulator